MTATFASENFLLREDWEERKKRLHEKRPVLQAIDGTGFLTAVTLLASYERHLSKPEVAVGCKRADVLRLTLAGFRKHADAVETGFRKAAELLAEQKVFDAKGLPYATQLIPMAVICTALGTKLDRWRRPDRLSKTHRVRQAGSFFDTRRFSGIAPHPRGRA